MKDGLFQVPAKVDSAFIVEQLRGLRVAVVGCGYWGAKHVRVLSGIPNVRQVAIVDPNPQIRAGLKLAFPAARPFPDLKSALPHIDAVVIATPVQSHGELALMALRSGKHVLVEKPLTRSLEQAMMLVSEARRVDRYLMAGHTFLFNPAVKELRRRLVQGELGLVRYIYSARLNLGLYRSDVNVIWDLAPHDITIMNYLLQSAPSAVSAWGKSLASTGVEDVAYIRLDYRQLGISGHSHLSWLDPRKTRTVTVVGEKKMAVYDDLADERLRIYDRGVDCPEGEAPAYERPLSYRLGDILSPHINFDEPLGLEDRHFVNCILTATPPDVTGVSGMVVIAVLEAIDRSLRAGTSVEVDYPFNVEGTGHQKQRHDPDLARQAYAVDHARPSHAVEQEKWSQLNRTGEP